MGCSKRCYNAIRKIAAGQPNAVESWVENKAVNPAIDWLAPKFGGDAAAWKQNYANNRMAWNIGGLGLGALGLTALGHTLLGSDGADRKGGLGSLSSWILPIGLLAGGGYLASKYGPQISSMLNDAQRGLKGYADIGEYGGKITKGVYNVGRDVKRGAYNTARGIKNRFSAVGEAFGLMSDQRKAAEAERQYQIRKAQYDAQQAAKQAAKQNSVQPGDVYDPNAATAEDPRLASMKEAYTPTRPDANAMPRMAAQATDDRNQSINAQIDYASNDLMQRHQQRQQQQRQQLIANQQRWEQGANRIVGESQELRRRVQQQQQQPQQQQPQQQPAQYIGQGARPIAATNNHYNVQQMERDVVHGATQRTLNGIEAREANADLINHWSHMADRPSVEAQKHYTVPDAELTPEAQSSLTSAQVRGDAAMQRSQDAQSSHQIERPGGGKINLFTGKKVETNTPPLPKPGSNAVRPTPADATRTAMRTTGKTR